MNYALDAGPMVAFLNDEPGAEVVEDLLTEPGSTCYAHAHNLCEIYYLYYRRGGRTAADSVIRDLLNLQSVLRSDLDTPFWKEAGALKGQPCALPAGRVLYLPGAAAKRHGRDDGPRRVRPAHPLRLLSDPLHPIAVSSDCPGG